MDIQMGLNFASLFVPDTLGEPVFGLLLLRCTESIGKSLAKP